MRVAALLTVLLCAAVTACSPFPKQVPWEGYDPIAYNASFNAAATEAVVQALTGKNYYEYFGEAAYTMIIPPVGCTLELWEKYLAKERACWLLSRQPDPECKNRDRCARFTIDSTVLSDRRIWPVIEKALTRPCDYLTDPRQVKFGAYPSVLGHSAEQAYELLECGSGGVVAENGQVEVDGNAVTIIFKRG